MAEVELPNPEVLHEHAQDRYAKTVALSVAVYAVALAFASLGGNNAMKDAMLAQMQASNKWAHYQAKSSREYLAKVMLTRLEIDRPEIARDGSAAKPLSDDIAKYSKEKDEIKAEAEILEAERSHAMKRDPYFDYSEVLLQIAIVLASVAILSKSRPPYFIRLILALAGAFFCFNGWTLMFQLPSVAH